MHLKYLYHFKKWIITSSRGRAIAAGDTIQEALEDALRIKSHVMDRIQSIQERPTLAE